jgi:phosphoesterase RecJ-like protein
VFIKGIDMKIAKEKKYGQILSAIKKYEKIAVYRHVIPDFDALGTQLGLATWIQNNFQTKTVKVLGENHSTFTPRLYPKMDIVDETFVDKNTLAIVVDTGSKARIDGLSYQQAGLVIKIDHHPDVETYGDISLVDTTTCAASELIMLMILSWGIKYTLSKQAGIFFYSGIAGDSGRFLYASISSKTFFIAQKLIETGIEVNEDVYLKMYEKTIDDLKVTAFLLNNFKVSDKGVAYYTLTHQQQIDLNISSERGKDNVNLFSNIKNIHVWCSVTEDIEDKVWRVSIRSKKTPINQVARKYEGGGHPQASGCKLNSITDLPHLIEDLDAIL